MTLPTELSWRRVSGAVGLLAMGMGLYALALAPDLFRLDLAERELDRWWRSGDIERLSHAQRWLEAAELSSSPRYHLLRAQALLASGEAATEDARLALEESARLRQSWPETWAWLAVAHLRAGEAELSRQAVDQALQHGPYSAQILPILLPALRGRWHLMQAAQREPLLELSVMAARRELEWVSEQMDRAGMLMDFCDLMQAHGERLDVCQRLGWSPLEGEPT